MTVLLAAQRKSIIILTLYLLHDLSGTDQAPGSGRSEQQVLRYQYPTTLLIVVVALRNTINGIARYRFTRFIFDDGHHDQNTATAKYASSLQMIMSENAPSLRRTTNHSIMLSPLHLIDEWRLDSHNKSMLCEMPTVSAPTRLATRPTQTAVEGGSSCHEA